jgi:hypothetical protein
VSLLTSSSTRIANPIVSVRTASVDMPNNNTIMASARIAPGHRARSHTKYMGLKKLLALRQTSRS